MNGSVVSAYVIGFVVLVVFVLLAVIVANAIPYEMGVAPRDKGKRRMWFWILGVLCPVAVFALCYFLYFQGIRVPSRATAYLTAMSISTGVAFVLYVVIGFALSKIFNHGKLSSWF